MTTDISPFLRFMAILNGDVECPASLAERTLKLLRAGVSCIQVRVKHKSAGDFLKASRSVVEVCTSSKIPVIINDRPDVAMLCGAAGVHLGTQDMPIRSVRSILPPGFWIGASARTPHRALEAQREGAHYLGTGAVRSTASKAEATVIGVEGVRGVADSVEIPVVAIGGIIPEDVGQLLSAGASGIAVLSPAMTDDPLSACRPYHKVLS